MIAVLRREWKSFFCRWSGYLFFGIFWALTGMFMLVYNFYYGYTGFEYPLAMLNVCFSFVLPLVTVPLFREEKKEGVSRFLGMLPLSAKALVWGKYFAALTMLGIVSVGMALCPMLLRIYGEISFATAYAAVLAFFLLGWALLSVEIFLSLMIRNQKVLWFVSYAVPVGLIALGYLANLVPGQLGELVSYLSLFGAYSPFLYGLLDGRSLVMWGSVIVVFTVLTLRFAMRIRKGSGGAA